MAKTYTKRLGILRKKDGMTHEQFVNHWMGTHAVLCSKLPKLRRYSVNLVDRKRFPKFDYDGFSELWFDSEADLVAAFASPEGKTLLADLPNFTGQIDPIISVETQILWP
ncbi:MAG TPA: EthD family reductase [Casimicrobiaceae bacterium]|nr:EthD family reductase [Casimicrobiaceae bacterium]